MQLLTSIYNLRSRREDAVSWILFFNLFLMLVFKMLTHLGTLKNIVILLHAAKEAQNVT